MDRTQAARAAGLLGLNLFLLLSASSVATAACPGWSTITAIGTVEFFATDPPSFLALDVPVTSQNPSLGFMTHTCAGTITSAPDGPPFTIGATFETSGWIELAVSEDDVLYGEWTDGVVTVTQTDGTGIGVATFEVMNGTGSFATCTGRGRFVANTAALDSPPFTDIAITLTQITATCTTNADCMDEPPEQCVGGFCVPTLSEWGIMLLTLLMMAMVLVTSRRRAADKALRRPDLG